MAPHNAHFIKGVKSDDRTMRLQCSFTLPVMKRNRYHRDRVTTWNIKVEGFSPVFLPYLSLHEGNDHYLIFSNLNYGCPLALCGPTMHVPTLCAAFRVPLPALQCYSLKSLLFSVLHRSICFLFLVGRTWAALLPPLLLSLVDLSIDNMWYYCSAWQWPRGFEKSIPHCSYTMCCFPDNFFSA